MLYEQPRRPVGLNGGSFFVGRNGIPLAPHAPQQLPFLDEKRRIVGSRSKSGINLGEAFGQ